MPLAAPLAPAVPQDVPLPSGADSSAWSRLTRDIDGDEDDTLFDPPPFPPEPAPPRNWPWRPAALAAAVLLAVGGGTAFVLLQSEPPPPISGVVTGPLLTVFAPVDGRLTHILVSLGTHVSGGTDLFEIEQAPPDPRARSDIAARLDLARTRAARLDQRQRELEGLIQRSRAVGADPVAAREAEAMRQRLGDLQDERGATAGEIALLERSLASDIARNSSLGAKRVKASQSGVIARLQAVEGMEVVPGLPLGQMIDCDHLSIAVDGPAAASLGIVSNRLLHVTLAGSAVTLDVHVPPASARPMRQTASDNAAIAAGGRLSIPLERVALEKAAGEACPVGRSATMSLE